MGTVHSPGSRISALLHWLGRYLFAPRRHGFWGLMLGSYAACDGARVSTLSLLIINLSWTWKILTNLLLPFFSHSPQPAFSNAVTHWHIPPLPWNTQCLWRSLDTFSCLSINKVYPFSPWGHISSSLLGNQSSSMCSCYSLQSVLLEIINKYEWLKFKNSNESVCLCMCPRDWERVGLGCL